MRLPWEKPQIINRGDWKIHVFSDEIRFVHVPHLPSHDRLILELHNLRVMIAFRRSVPFHHQIASIIIRRKSGKS